MICNLINTPKSAAAKIFLSSFLPLFSRLVLTVSGSQTTGANLTEGVPSLTFLHNFIDCLELQKPAAMVITAARQLARLNPDSTLTLCSLQTREKIMVVAGMKPSSVIKKDILDLQKKYSTLSSNEKVVLGCAAETPLRVVYATHSKNRLSGEPPETLSLTAATKVSVKSDQFILYTTSIPSPKERQLLNYCLQHLEKRINEA